MMRNSRRRVLSEKEKAVFKIIKSLLVFLVENRTIPQHCKLHQF